MTYVERLMNLVVELAVGECLTSKVHHFYTFIKQEGNLEIWLDRTNILVHYVLCFEIMITLMYKFKTPNALKRSSNIKTCETLRN